MNKHLNRIETFETHNQMAEELNYEREYLRKLAIATKSDYRLPHEIAITIMAAANEVITKKGSAGFPDGFFC
jgi:hypothetical protein